MSNALTATNGSQDLITFDREKVNLIKQTVARGATDQQLALFLHQAQRTGLDPLARQIHCILRKNNRTGNNDMSIQTAIDGYRLIADRTGKYAGSDDYMFNEGLTQYQHMTTGDKQPVTATVTVYKIVSGVRVPFTATAAWDAYFPDGSGGFMWRKMPHLMLGKCAEALALRKAFPAELSGVYIREEMEQAGFVEVENTAVEGEIVDDEPDPGFDPTRDVGVHKWPVTEAAADVRGEMAPTEQAKRSPRKATKQKQAPLPNETDFSVGDEVVFAAGDVEIIGEVRAINGTKVTVVSDGKPYIKEAGDLKKAGG